MALIELSDGRQLDVSVSGSEGAFPLLFHHGTPGAGTPFRFLERAAHERGLRVISYSRPGYGSSTRLPGRDIAAVADDVRQVLDHVGADGCVTAGWSGGGPHALATGALLPDRVLGVLVMAGAGPNDAPDLDLVAGMGEQNVVEFGLAVAGESALWPVHEKDRPDFLDADAAKLIESLRTLLPDVDRAVITSEFGEDLAASFNEALRMGVDGWVDDDLAFVKPWGFDLDAIKAPVFIWQGGADLMVPFAHGEWLASHVPNVTAHLDPAEGHLSIVIGAVEAMLDELVAVI